MYLQEIEQCSTELFDTFRDLHMHPEIGYEEFRTSGIIASRLHEYGLDVREHVALTGVVGTLDSGRPGKTVMLRADMDCLEVQELAKTGYESQHPGRMHACGHDSHVTMLLGAAKILSRHREAFSGKIRFVFQPSEEGIPLSARQRVREAGYEGQGGAGFMIREGVLDGVDACVIMHVQPAVPVGKVMISRRNACASSDIFRITIRGRGGHGAQPQNAIDPVPAMAELITAIHMLPSREISAIDTCVLSIGSVETPGSVWNAVAQKACLAGGIRTFNTDVRSHLNRRVRELSENIAAANRCTAEVEQVAGYAPCINDAAVAEIIAESCRRTLGAANVIFTDVPAMTSEDCGEYMSRVPGVFFWLGVADTPDAAPLHSPYFHLNTEALLFGVKVHVNNALSLLAELNGESR